MLVWNYVHRPQHFLISHAWCCDLMWGKARICFNLFCTINFIGWCWQLLLVYPLDPSDYFLPCVLIANLSVYNLRPKVHVDHIPTLMWALHYVHLYSFQTYQSIHLMSTLAIYDVGPCLYPPTNDSTVFAMLYWCFSVHF